MKNTKSKENPREKCLKDLTHYVKWARMDDGLFLNIEPLKHPIVHTTKDNKKLLLLATLVGSDKDGDKILEYLSKNVRYDGDLYTFHGCYLPGDIFACIELPSEKKESVDVIDIANEAEKMITNKSMEYDAKAFINLVKTNLIQWEKSLERGKHGNPCNFKDVSKKIDKLRQEIIDDEDGVLGNTHVLFVDTTRYLNLMQGDLYDLVDTTQEWMGKHFSSGLAREESIAKTKKKINGYNGGVDSVRADKKDYRLSFLLDEFDEMIDAIENLISPDKSHKTSNIFRILEDYSGILESLGAQVDCEDDTEDKKMLMKQYTYSKELIREVVMAIKNTVGNLYGSIVAKVMSK